MVPKTLTTDSSERNRTIIADIASSWSLYGNIEFDFGRSLEGIPRLCDDDFDHGIRITTIENANYSYLGIHALNIEGRRPTLSISDSTLRSQNDTVVRNVILHEFGHALALTHTNLHPNFCVDEIDWDYVYDYYGERGWTPDRVRRNFILPSLQTSSFDFGVYDRNSIMQHHFPAEFYFEREKSRCFGNADGLQITDRLAVFVTYPYDIEEH